HRNQGCEVASCRGSGYAEAFWIDFIIRGVQLDITDACLDMACHFRSGITRSRTRPNREHCVTPGTEDLIKLAHRVFADFATVREPSAADHVNDCQAICLSFGREDVH